MGKIIHISVRDKVALYSARDGAIICGNDDYQVQFALDPEWDGVPAKARFIWNGQYEDAPIVGGVAKVPRIIRAREVRVGVYSEDESLQTTTAARVPCGRSILCDTAEPTEGNEAFYASEAQEAADRAEAAADRAEAAGGSGGTGGGVVIDPESVNQAQEAAQAAQESAEAAADFAQAAGQSAEEAETSKNQATAAKEAAAESAAEAANAEQTATTAADIATGAQAAAETAQGKAEGARDTAVANAEAASTSATVAAREAGNASKSAAAAATDRTAAETAAGTATSAKAAAEAARDTASQKATEANEAKGAAQTAKGEAQTAATNAGKSATAAAGSATTASNAATAAQTAQGKAETASTEAEQKAAEAKNAAQEAATAQSGAESAADRAEAAAGTAESIVQRVNSGDLRGEDGKSPTMTVSKVGSVVTLKVKNADGTESSAEVLDGITQVTPLYAESAEWLNENGEADKTYVLPDGYIYHRTQREVVTEREPLFTDQIPLSINKDGSEYVGDNGEDGYNPGYRYSASSAVDKKQEHSTLTFCTVGFIKAKAGDRVRIKGTVLPTTANDSSGYACFYCFNSSFTKLGGSTMLSNMTLEDGTTDVYWIDVPSNLADTAYIRITAFNLTDESIITVGEEIAYSSGGTTVIIEWKSTGHAFIPADYEDRVIDLESKTSNHDDEIAALKEVVESGGSKVVTYDEALELIKTWDAPINDSGIPVFTLDKEAKQARTDASHHTVAAIYAAYDKLATDYPQFVTREVVGETATKSHEIVKYEFKEPEPHWGLTSRAVWSETKQKAIIISGVHPEFGGIWSLYYALEELCSNPDLWDLRRNIHLIVLPVANPYGVDNASVRNDRGVEMRRNFEVDFLYPDDEGYLAPGETHHGGTSPLSEEESIIIDEIMSANTDAAFFQSCHSNQIDEIWGTGFTWASPATYYMCNMAYRNIDKLSAVWMEKYGDELAAGIADYRTENLASWDTRLGRANLSSTNGTETKQATKYGIQSINIEVTDRFLTHGTKANPEPICSAFTLSRGAEVYVNFWRIAFGLYDHKDKDKYTPVPAFKLE